MMENKNMIQPISRELIIPCKKGYLSGSLIAPNGSVIETFEQHVLGNTQNLIVDRASIGMAYSMKKFCEMAHADSREMIYIAIGTGNTTAASTDTTLDAEISRVNVTGGVVFSDEGTDPTIQMTINGETCTNKLRISGLFGTSVVGQITEAGIFIGEDANSTGTGAMFNRKAFTAWNKTDEFSLMLSWLLVF
jgi:hypothetical protein